MDLSNVFAFDTETTGVDTKTAHVVEVALYNDKFEFCELIKPPSPIPPEVSAVHHICNEDVENCRTRDQVFGRLREHFSEPPLPILVAHNAAFDRAFFADAFPAIWICTYKVSLRLWPDAPNHKNETLRYYLGLGPRGRNQHQASHSALHDCKVTWLLLLECLKHATLEQLVQWTEEPAKISKLSFGKHMGKKLTDPSVDYGYLKWIVSNMHDNPDLQHCAKEEIKRRGYR